MSLLPILAAREVLRRLFKAGFKISKSKGGHIKLFNPVTKRETEIPMHPGDLGRKLITKIIKQAGLTIDKFLKL